MTARGGGFCSIVAACLVLGIVLARVHGAQASPQDLILGAFDNADYAEAARLLRLEIEDKPSDAILRYNLACALSRLGEEDDAVESLLDAIARGFVDLHELERDPDLAPLHRHPTFRLILDGWARILSARAAAELEAMRRAFGSEYRFDQDETHRLNFASAFDEQATAEARREIDRVAAWAYARLLPPPPPTDDPRPDPWVTVILPTELDFLRLVRSARVGGIYDKDAKRLVTRDLGPSLRHEYFHVLHWRDMGRIGQTHPYWIMEGLASVLEDVEVDGNDAYIIRPSWRTNIAKRLERAGRLTPWRQFFALDRAQFLGSRARAFYAQARAIFMFMDHEGKLDDWYRAYTDSFEADPSGADAIAVVFGEPLEAVERRYKLWLRGLEMVAEIDHPASAGFGVVLGPGRGEGPVVERTVAASRAARTRDGQSLRRRDVILAINGQDTRTLDDLHRILGEHDVGSVVTVTVKRARLRLELELELVEQIDETLLGF